MSHILTPLHTDEEILKKGIRIQGEFRKYWFPAFDRTCDSELEAAQVKYETQIRLLAAMIGEPDRFMEDDSPTGRKRK